MLPHSRGQAEAVPARGNWFGSDSCAFGGGRGFVYSLPWCWILHPIQKGVLGADPAPGAAPVVDAVRVGALGGADSDPCVHPH